MLKSVFLKTMRDMLIPLAAWAGGMLVLCLWILTLMPSVEDAGLMEYMANLPESVRMLTGNVTDISSWQGYISVEMLGFFAPMMLLSFGIAYGGGLIGSEEDGGTLDLLLSNPIPRWRVVLEKFAALVVFTVVVLVANYVGYMLGALSIDLDIDPVRLLEGTFNLLPITLFFSSLAFCLTCLRRGRGLAIGVSAGLAFVSYLVTALASVGDMPEWSQHLSPWFYYAGTEVLFDGLDWGKAGVLLGLTAALVALGMWGFSQRDLGT
jgi:ABC-2 type transport system permease protein